MKNSMKWVYWCLFVGVVGLSSSCNNEEARTATIQVRLTDAPGDYQAVNIDIENVQVNTGESDTGWKSLDVNKGVYNLLELTNGLDTLLGTVEIPAGRVKQLRLVLGSNNSVKVAGETISLTTPSAQQSGLKIILDTTFSAGITYNITLDFDAARSIVPTGSSKYILKPVIHSIVMAQSGAIKGIVQPIASTPAIYAIQGTDTVETTYIDQATGKFLLKGLVAGTYDISFVPGDGYLAKTVGGISVSVGATTNLDTVRIMQ